MRALLVLSILMVASATPSRAADTPKLAVFDFEMLDTSQEGRMPAKRTDEQERLMRIGDQLRKELGESGKFQILDISPVNAAAHQSNLQSCGGCDVKLAQQLGADLEITGVVQKVSNVILNMSVFLRDAHTGRLVTAANADMPGNTDETWSHTTHYLVRERLLAPNYGRPQAN
ncbi:MAG TPA: DUF3280 domain-containing protein [Bradyrhizobium sp.]|uniref:DUF3280 domain-containing protein n=1 Tax=Bradyrhizobium sp. TaxID=376 RepID=UPI002B956885|nr:DUF3280 domain-containing protein [Bradyrhizobium sp.]HLZ04742.1 DUF3280 domain-containing protein [Bradyrhizobium sp.]